jgi:hypothetical protein
MRGRTIHRKPRRESGAALVELAFVLTLLLTLFGGMVELGRAIYQYETLTKSARNAARYLSQYSPLDAAAYPLASAKCLAVYGNTGCTGSALVPGLSATNVVVCDRKDYSGCVRPGVCDGSSSSVCPYLGYLTYDASDNANTGPLVGSIRFVQVKITGFAYSPIQSFFPFVGVTFGDVSVLMRQS